MIFATSIHSTVSRTSCISSRVSSLTHPQIIITSFTDEGHKVLVDIMMASPVTQICSICGAIDIKCIEFHDCLRARKLLCCENQCIIGKDVPVCRDKGLGWHVGKVTLFDSSSFKHFVSFIDGTAEWVTIDPMPMSAYLAQCRDNAKMRDGDDCPFKMFQMSPSSINISTPRHQHLLLSPPKRTKTAGLNDNNGRQRILKVSECVYKDIPPYSKQYRHLQNLQQVPCIPTPFIRRCSLFKIATIIQRSSPYL